MKNKEYIDINKIAELKGLKSNRSLRLAIQKGKYVARVVKVFGGKSYEILYSSLEPEIQEKLQDELIKEVTQSNCTALVPINNINNKNFITESAKLTALARVDIVKALQNMRTKYITLFGYCEPLHFLFVIIRRFFRIQYLQYISLLSNITF